MSGPKGGKTETLEKLSRLISDGYHDGWADDARGAFEELYGGNGGRYPKHAETQMTLRVPKQVGSDGVPFAALIHPANPVSGPYGGMSFVLFPVPEGPPMIAMVAGTMGISPDEEVLGRPGHARKVAAICGWLNACAPGNERVAWAKHDPTRTDLPVPLEVQKAFPQYHGVFSKYGNVLYGFYAPIRADDPTALLALRAFLDLAHDERKIEPLANARGDAEDLKSNYFRNVMPDARPSKLRDLLTLRRYVVVEGPPGTGKTRAALELLRGAYGGHGLSIQFHPNTTYETFVGGLSPTVSDDGFGFRFTPQPGFLMQAAAAAIDDPTRDYLLHIDEINRADLSKVLGEAIYLLEASRTEERSVVLPYDFGEPFRHELRLPANLHILGTMNSADRSIAILDVAIRRRFAFVKLWPQSAVVQSHGSPLMGEAFQRLMEIFIEFASDDALGLMPGHSYFMEGDDGSAVQALQVNLLPLLEEYIDQGYVAGFAEELRAYMQWIRGLAS